MTAVKILVGNINEAIINPLIALLFTAATVYFLWGVMQYLWAARENADQEEGKMHMLMGVIGMALMVSVYGVLRVATGTFGIPCPGC